MPSAETKVNQRYCTLLSETFEKYKDINVVPRNIRENDDESDPHHGSYTKLQNEKHLIKCNKDGKTKSNKYKYITNFNKSKKPFSRDEDEIIIDQVGDKKLSIETLKKLSVELNRQSNSIRKRVRLLRKEKISGAALKHSQKRFTLQEDMLIIDQVIVALKKCGQLENAELENPDDLILKLDRTRTSVFNRWKTKIKPWLLQYYNKTLNLEIRPMLTRVIADNFDSVGSIDWESLTKFPELSGHSPSSLTCVFSHIITSIVHHQQHGVCKSELTLPKIAEVSKEIFENASVRKSTEKRQLELIQYFVKLMKQNNVTNFI